MSVGESAFKVGDPVAKMSGDYTYSGVVVAVLTKRSGAVRLVVEDDRGLLFIFSEKQLVSHQTIPAAPPGVPPLRVLYRNHRGEESWRHIVPMFFRYGTSTYHGAEQWLLECLDVDKNAHRTFALADVLEWQGVEPSEGTP